LAYIKRVEMRGFKTFGSKKISVPLDRGFTVITGPNGSGKSNILDAIRFVLGDLSARSLRADKMSEVIFDGGRLGSSEAARTAQISILLDNQKRQIPVDTGTVHISRKVNRNGISEYLLNGKNVSRSHLIDILSIAGLSSAGHNIVMQGTITRLTDITPVERRKLIEDLVGISEYDVKKGQAQNQLRQAETNLRIASARIGDVRSRLEHLEEERNDAIRHNFIQGEIKKLQAIIASFKMKNLEAVRAKLLTTLQEQKTTLHNLKEQQKKLLLDRDNIELRRREFDEEVADKGNIKLVNVQNALGDIMTNIAKMKMTIDSGTTSLKGFKKIREERIRHLKVLNSSIRETKKNLSELIVARKQLKHELNTKTTKHQTLSSELLNIKKNIDDNSQKIKKIEEEMYKLGNEAHKLDAKIKVSTTRQKIVTDNLKTLEDRQLIFESTIKGLQTQFKELQRLRVKEQENLVNVSESIANDLNLKSNLIADIDEAENTRKIAEEAVAEYEIHRNLAEKIGTTDAALMKIEELSETGAIDGLFGRLENLIKVNPRYQKAIDVASSGWIKAIVVKDMEVALKCIERLKKMKIGRIKLIPLSDVQNYTAVAPPDIEGVIDIAPAFIKCDDAYSSVVNFALGDTVITSSEKAAFLASKAGYRAVDLNGDLYEAGGGIEGGYYRSPIPISSLIPSENTITVLHKSVKSLENLMGKRKNDINSLDTGILSLNEDKIKRSETIKAIERNLDLVNQNMARAKQNILAVNKKIRGYQKAFESEDYNRLQNQSNEGNLRKKIVKLKSQRKRLEKKTTPSNIAKYETEEHQLKTEIDKLNRRLIKIESDTNLLELNLETTLKPELKRANIGIKTLERQISTLQEEIDHARTDFREANQQLSELEESKRKISESLSSVKDRRKEFEEQLDNANIQLRTLSQNYNSLANEVHVLELEVQSKASAINHLKEELLGLGYTDSLSVTSEETKTAKSSLSLLQFELEKLGSVNQLAITQYSEQQINYKHLSSRLYQLEAEKKSIVDFMEEIEREKKEVFVEAYNEIKESFVEFFSKLTGGGVGYLSQQNQEDPFAAGIDIFVQFPGKNSRLIASASGGEKSVTAVSFIFAIQSMSPAPFYLLDEIDAHLDVYNSERLADLLKQQSATSQLIAITLRDVIMDRADWLFGVYIQNGISKIVSTKIEEVTS